MLHYQKPRSRLGSCLIGWTSRLRKMSISKAMRFAPLTPRSFVNPPQRRPSPDAYGSGR
jgi:hypothetical protein